MQTSHPGRVLAAFLLAALASCSRSQNPFTDVKDPPLLEARLHTVTLVTDGPGVGESLQAKGYQPVPFASNYPVSNEVESAMWGVPLRAVEGAAHYKSPDGTGAGVRVLKMALAAKTSRADARVEKAFFRNVLGSDVPSWPPGIEPADKVRVQVWTYLIPDVLVANKRLRENGIPVVFDPVAITTAYLGDHKVMAIRAPDGAIVELVQTAAL
ncbi:MAG TPA: hypothetical protein VFU13_08925 [Steroidobacteraceae bacterium]|nr:hypothetical protein [Steroidobacteraceae bacterium]